MGDERQPERVDRRTFVQAMATAAAAGVAGCSGNGGETTGGGAGNDGDSGGATETELGERVPPVRVEYMAGIGGISNILATSAEAAGGHVQERLGVQTEVVPVEYLTEVTNVTMDKRTANLAYWPSSLTPTAIDPDQYTSSYRIQEAGAVSGNLTQYASCDYTYYAEQQRNAASREERTESVNNAHEIMSQDVGTIPTHNMTVFGAVRTDMVDPQAIGDRGLTQTNPRPYILTEPKDGDQLVTSVDLVTLSTTNFPSLPATQGITTWSHLIHSPLLGYSEELELENVLAESVERSDDGRTVTVTLKDATFHNGDTVTAEDVKYTFDYLQSVADIFPHVDSIPYESIEVRDDRTTVFTLTRPYAPLINSHFTLWGVLHKETWEAGNAMDAPQEFSMDPIVGSGPFQVEEFTQDQHLELTPHDGNPKFSPDHDLLMRGFREGQTALQAFLNGEIHLAVKITPGNMRRIRNELPDAASTRSTAGFLNTMIYPQMSYGPAMFREFRAAVAAAINRQEINQQALYGNANVELYSCPFAASHPWRPPEDRLTRMAESPQGSRERARQVLSDAGWGWDEQGRLRYPADADLTPLWPKGETPSPEEFPCLTEDGGFSEEYTPS